MSVQSGNFFLFLFLLEIRLILGEEAPVQPRTYLIIVNVVVQCLKVLVMLQIFLWSTHVTNGTFDDVIYYLT